MVSSPVSVAGPVECQQMPLPPALVYFFLIGALCPLAVWLISFKWPNSWIRYIK